MQYTIVRVKLIMSYIENWEQVVVSETDDKKKDNSVNVHDILLYVVIVCLQIDESHKQGEYLETKTRIMQNTKLMTNDSAKRGQ